MNDFKYYRLFFNDFIYRIDKLIFVLLFFLLSNCSVPEKDVLIPVIFDTDANNEVDDQHALAYLLFSGSHFDLVGVTVNATSVPGKMDEKSDIIGHLDEARRVLALCGGLDKKITLQKGADGSFAEISDKIDKVDFDGESAVNFIINESMKPRESPLVLLAVGKLTNIALALKKEPLISNNIRVVWLGSNYPEPGEHNLLWDIEAMNYILQQEVLFEIVTVRYNNPSGSSAVMFSQEEMIREMAGVGPNVSPPVMGRTGDEFSNFGDYSVKLFSQIPLWGDPPGRALFDAVAVAVLKSSQFAQRREIPAPIYQSGGWVDRPDNSRKIILWEWFDVEAIRSDFFKTMKSYKLVN